MAHPTASDVKLSFDGRKVDAPTSEECHGQSHDVARQLLVHIAAAIERPRALARGEIAS